MNTEHTPGPWYDKLSAGGHQGLVISESTGATVALTYDAADRALVAAAPDLLDILDRIVRAHDSGNNGAVMGEATLCKSFAYLARSAINKAKGL